MLARYVCQERGIAVATQHTHTVVTVLSLHSSPTVVMVRLTLSISFLGKEGLNIFLLGENEIQQLSPLK